jgi:hypothetical protein
MSNHQSSRTLSPQQLARLGMFIYAEPFLDHKAFIAKWNVSRELVAQICHVDIRTCNSWFSLGRSHQEPQPYHKWYLSLADIILDQFEELPEYLQNLLCPLHDDHL